MADDNLTGPELREDEPLRPVEPVARPEPESLFPEPVEPVAPAPLPESIENEMVENGEPVERLEPEETAPPVNPNRRSTFQLLGVLLVWYYVYTLIRSLVNNEVEPGQRGLLIGFVVIMALANVFLTYQTAKVQWKQYKDRRDTSDT